MRKIEIWLLGVGYWKRIKTYGKLASATTPAVSLYSSVLRLPVKSTDNYPPYFNESLFVLNARKYVVIKSRIFQDK